MQLEHFIESMQQNIPPSGSSVYLQAMWYDAKGDWHKAHTLADSLHDTTAFHIHAYLHRKEGDAGNAAYWYRRAGKPMPRISLQEEWEQLVRLLL
jgi:hypothetical protein